MAGAAYFSSLAAYRMGVGLVTVYTPESNRCILQQLLPEAVLKTYPDTQEDFSALPDLLKNYQAIVLGPGPRPGTCRRKYCQNSNSFRLSGSTDH